MQDLFHYERMVERALRGVVREALLKIAREGPQGAHHFYIAFATGMPEVGIAEHLRERYPQEMTIVLQHQFWDLEVAEESFSVTLSFQKQLERLTVPFAAIRSFADPSVNFVLEFAAEPAAEPRTVGSLPAPKGSPGPERPEKDAPAGAEVVTLDSFRKR